MLNGFAQNRSNRSETPEERAGGAGAVSKCEHMNFRASVEVARLTDGDLVTRYSADIKINCIECHTPFHFIGIPAGLSPSHPSVSFGGDELRAPIAPGLKIDHRLIPNEA
ncbi:hypothetical protein LCGC14_1279090 [marine sediment metagenome]|uniref:Uncharacterized protein n=1 Tax=marine sediment metagenome TaxID=412755 RepID=A0A0F9NCG6_9ZZZZ